MQPWPPMSAPAPVPGARRPGSVLAAAMLLMVSVALCLAEVVVAIMGAIDQRHYESQVSDSSDYQLLTVLMIVLVGLNVVFAIGLSAGALLSLRGRGAGRWVALGFAVPTMFLHCGCGGLAGTGVYGASHGDVNPFPNWLFTVDIVVNVLTLATVAVAVVLLLLRPAATYFRGSR